MPEFTEHCVPEPDACSCPGQHGPGGWNVHHVAPCCAKPHTEDPEQVSRYAEMRLEVAALKRRVQDAEHQEDLIRKYDPNTGQWEVAVPIPVQGWVAKVEFWLRDRGFKRLPNLLAWWDERGLG